MESRRVFADRIAARIRTAPVEDQAQSLAHRRDVGSEYVEAELRNHQSQTVSVLLEWLLSHGWTQGENPDFTELFPY